jgi:hypothetical protein
MTWRDFWIALLIAIVSGAIVMHSRDSAPENPKAGLPTGKSRHP